jgi:hypothetical protein
VLVQYIVQTQQSFQRDIAEATSAEERRDAQLACDESHPQKKIKTLPKTLEIVVSLPWLWSLETWEMDSPPLSYVYDADRGRWVLNVNHLCPVHRCEKLVVDERKWPSWYICDVCRPAFEFWTSWCPVALMAVNRDFAEVEERREPKQLTEREMRQKREGQGYKDVPVTHTKIARALLSFFAVLRLSV